MNILPKKRWHVRTRDNINRVRRDEAKAAEEEREKERRIEVAGREARLTLLRNRAKANRIVEPNSEPKESSSTFDHVNFFKDLENGETTKNSNAENVAEKKQDQEEWEKKMGILTYLGGDRVDQAWWEKGRVSLEEKEDEKEKDGTRKGILDPLKDIRGYLGTSGVKRLVESCDQKSSKKKKKRSSSPKSSKRSKKSKKRKKHKRKKYSSSSSDSADSDVEDKRGEKEKKKALLDKLRQERLQRENKERIRESRVKNGLSPDPLPEEEAPPKEDSNRKYNSQFNPDIARQNKLNGNTKYWMQ